MADTEVETPLEILQAARTFIERPEQWWQGGDDKSNRRPGQSCLMVAIAQAGMDYDDRAYRLIYDVIQPLRADKDFDLGVVAFNDAPTTTHADVLRVMDAAIELAKADVHAD